MNILEALKAGKRIRRSSWDNSDYTWREPNMKYAYTFEDLTATDWIADVTPSEFYIVIDSSGFTCGLYRELAPAQAYVDKLQLKARIVHLREVSDV